MDEEPPRAWHEIVRDVLKRHEVKLVTYVPDNVLRPLIEGIHADPYFTAFACTREEEAIGINAGASDYLPKPVDADKLMELIKLWARG